MPSTGALADGLRADGDRRSGHREPPIYGRRRAGLDLLIRTGGEQRISNFLIWQAAYAELYFTDLLWPDFEPATFDAALTEYARRTRRFGR